MPLRLGTRGSPLARWQAEWTAGELRALGYDVELVPIVTSGDAQQVGPIGAIGTQGVFTKELQRALLDGTIDFSVHSLKDLPTEPIEGLTLASVPARGPIGDCLVSAKYRTWEELPQGAIVGTGSQRRRAQLLHARPDLRMEDVRGNVDTRLRKLAEGQYAAIILAEAGLVRLKLDEHIAQVLPRAMMLPAIGQGALGLEARADDETTLSALARLDDEATHSAVVAERSLLHHLRGGCLAPVGGWGRFEDDRLLHLSGVVLKSDGTARLFAHHSGAADDAEDLGRTVAEELLEQGAAALISASRVAGHTAPKS
ncbi:MAG: hydroxymethylbilane synthase [Planctomycetaceae bacterium]|nr:hydroxymethylbilane synthase [Planctomycetaceae bacterium]